MREQRYTRNAFTGEPMKEIKPGVPRVHEGVVTANLELERNRLRAALEKIKSIAEGRRHYDADEFSCYDALGEIRALCEEVL